MALRGVRADELSILQDIERDAGRLFAEIGMHEIADDEPPSLDELEQHRVAGCAWIAVDADDRPVGYVLVEMLDGNAHIEQVSVRLSSSRRGIGRSLVDHVAEWAQERGIPALTLTTFTDVPWNAPYYAQLGFRTLAQEEETIGLQHKRTEEAAHGLDRWPRVCMRRDL